MSAVPWIAAGIALAIALTALVREARACRKWNREQAAAGRLALIRVAEPVGDDTIRMLKPVPYGTVTDEAERICKEAAGG